MASKVEKYIRDYTRNCSNELCSVEDRYGKTIISYREWLTPDQALRAAEIAKEETIEKACKWLNDWAYLYVNDYTGSLDEKALVEDFRKTMEE